MKIQCPKCQKMYRLSDDRVPSGGSGFKVRCKQCGTIIDVTTSSLVEESDLKASSNERSSSEIKATMELKWYVAFGGERQGPFTTGEVEEKIRSGEYGPETYAWHKGFKGWEKLSNIEEFKTLFPEQSAVDETQMMSLSEVTKLTGTASDASRESETTEEPKEQMVWSRRETSVLFSLEEYKSRRKTGVQPAVESLVQVKPLEAPKEVQEQPKRATQKVGVINLDEAEIKRVAEELARRKRQRKILAVTGASVLGVVIIAGAVAYVVTQQRTEPMTSPVPSVVEVKPVAPPLPVPQPTQPQQVAAPVVTGVVPAHVPAPVTPAEKTTTKPKKTDTKTEPKSKEVVAVSSPQPVATKPPKEEKVPEDVNTMLANFRKGQASGTTGQQDTGTTSSAGDNLPEQLSTGIINSVMRKKQAAVEACIKNAQIPAGTTVRAMARLTISGSGQVSSVSVQNAGEAAACIENVLRGLTFPKFKAENQTITYPYIVQM